MPIPALQTTYMGNGNTVQGSTMYQTTDIGSDDTIQGSTIYNLGSAVLA